jgi:glutaredoxin-dependent peroxiredoxin
MAIAVGSKAPDFTLKTKNAEGLHDVSLADHAGKDNVVLLFFPAAFTGVCTQEMCDVTGGVHPLPGAVVYGVSHDSPFAQEAWAKVNNISVTLLSDYSNQAAEAYDVVLPDLVGLGPASKRAAILIGKDGIVKYSEETPTPLDLPNFGAIAETLASL